MARRSMRAGAIVVLAVWTLLMLGLGQAYAHTALSGSSPGEGEVLERTPAHVHLTFSGRLEGAAELHTIAVIGPDGAAVELAEPQLSEDRKVLLADLKEELTAGEYTVQYRVVSSDGHPIEGEFGFVVEGQPAGENVPTEPTPETEKPTETEAEPVVPADEHAGHEPEVGEGNEALGGVFAAGLFGSRILYYATFLPLLGWALWSALQRLAADRLMYWRRVGAVLLAAHLAAFVVHVAFQWSELTAGSSAAVSFVDMLRHTATGQSWLFTGLLSVAGFPLLFRYRAVDAAWAVAMVAAKTLRGHASAFEPVGLSRLADGVHLGAAALWVGGLLALVLLLRRSAEWARDFGPVFSTAALVSFGVLAVSGTVSTLLYTEQLADLVRTTWGVLLLVKLALAIAVLPIAAWLRRRVRRAAPESSGFRRLLYADAAILLGVIGLTAVLTHLSPVVERETFHWHVMGETVHLTADIEDVREGSNTLSLKIWVPSGDQAPVVTAEVEEAAAEAGPTGITLVKTDIPAEEWESFQGFDKYTFTGEVFIEEPADAVMRIIVERANGETYPHEKTLTSP